MELFLNSCNELHNLEQKFSRAQTGPARPARIKRRLGDFCAAWHVRTQLLPAPDASNREACRSPRRWAATSFSACAHQHKSVAPDREASRIVRVRTLKSFSVYAHAKTKMCRSFIKQHEADAPKHHPVCRPRNGRFIIRN